MNELISERLQQIKLIVQIRNGLLDLFFFPLPDSAKLRLIMAETFKSILLVDDAFETAVAWRESRGGDNYGRII